MGVCITAEVPALSPATVPEARVFEDSINSSSFVRPAKRWIVY